MREYFNCTFKMKAGAPVTSMKLRDDFKKADHAFRKPGQPYSGIELGFYLHHIDDHELAHKLWEYRKKFANKNRLLELLMLENMLTTEDKVLVAEWQEKIDAKMKKNYSIAMKSEKTRSNIKKANTPQRRAHHSSVMKAVWQNPEMREKYMSALYTEEVSQSRVKNFKKHLADPDNYARFLEAMRDPARIEKISIAAKNMWKNATLSKRAKMNNHQHSSLKYKGWLMNSIELKVAQYLDTCSVPWEYEPVIKIAAGPKFYQPDFVVNGTTVIECYGDFWHANPLIYESHDVLFSDRTAGAQWKKDERRINDLKTVFSQVIILWEREIISGAALKQLEGVLNDIS